MRHDWIPWAALSGALTVVLGAFGAHALEERLSVEQLEWWHTAVLYQGLHSAALLGVGLLQRLRAIRAGQPLPGGALRAAGWAMALGILLFSGSLYAMALGGPRALGAVTPFGGVGMIVGWVLLAIAAWKDAGAGPAPSR